ENGLVYVSGEERGEILVPGIYLKGRDVEVGDVLEVFVYRDSEDRLIATTETPIAMVDEFGFLEVVAVNQKVGVFLDWGLGKDLLLPFREQKEKLSIGEKTVARILVDEQTDRIVASTRINRYLDNSSPTYDSGQAVKLIVLEKTPLGYNAIVENEHRGLLYDSDLPGALQVGQSLDGFVRAVRPDGGIDLALTESGFGRIKPLAEQIIAALENNDGFLEIDDKSPPEEIQRVFGTSKKAFKQALGGLYKKRKITFEKPGIRLVK
ncbi:MAG: putative RNA-binding protein (virulence factor B family), partial [Verrucomicrobiales bacterium]